MKTWLSTAVPTLDGAGPPLRLHDTTTGGIRLVAEAGTIRMYVCGITPYDATHVGHAATYVAFDLVQRVLRDRRQTLLYVQNVTDIDDPLLERARRDGEDWRVLGMEETDLYRADMQALRVLPPSQLTGVVESIPAISDAVGSLLDSGRAYRIPDAGQSDVYFDIGAADGFGKVSQLDPATMLDLAGARGGDPRREGKRHPLDPLLWRAGRQDEPSWKSSLGRGRPGWHIGCATIATAALRAPLDIQGGGSDLTFPHHECTAALAETLTGKVPYARHYMHTEMVHHQGQKMSKSTGNLVRVSDLHADGWKPSALRLAIMSHHYRARLEWTDDLLSRATARLDLWRRAFALDAASGADGLIGQIRTHLVNDLDTPSALSSVDRWADDALAHPSRERHGPELAARAVDSLLGVVTT